MRGRRRSNADGLSDLFFILSELAGELRVMFAGRRPAPAKWTPEFIASKEFLRTPEWKRVRYECLCIHGGRCKACGRSAADGAVINVDHIKPRKTHPHLALDVRNTQPLCEFCNEGKGNRDATDWRSPSAR